MTLLETIRTEQIRARKARDGVRTSLLTTLLSEAANVGLNDGKRESTDAEVIAVIKKFIKNIDETLAVRASDDLLVERAILEGFLPSQLSEDELLAAVVSIVAELELDGQSRSMKMMGPVMKTLKERFEGQFDGKAASETVKRTLTS